MTIRKNSAFKYLQGHHIVAKPSTAAVCYDKWSLSNALWMKFYNSHDK